MDKETKRELEKAILNAFSPHTPINEARFFAGRTEQLRAILDTIRTVGLHAIIYGERGVGKTSLATIIRDYLEDVVAISRVACSANETFIDVVRRSLSEYQLTLSRPGVGFVPDAVSQSLPLGSQLAGSALTPDGVGELLASVPPHLVLVIDEFDRLPRTETSAFADLVKSLSDRGAYTTLVLVGVASTIDALIADHASVERCLRQIPLPRMSDEESREIVDQGLRESNMAATDSVVNAIVQASQGFPHYTHLIAQEAARAAVDADETTIGGAELLIGMRRAVEHAQQTHREAYRRATTATRSNNIWQEVVLACALADADEQGYFSIRHVQEALAGLLERRVVQQTVTYHLGGLIRHDRGPLLERTGPERRYRYRFVDPMMKPFIRAKAVADGLLTV